MALLYPLTLDGSTPFLDVQGNPITWSADRYILSAALFGPDDQTFVPHVNLIASDWTITRLEIVAADGQVLDATISEGDSGTGRFIEHLGVGGSSRVILANTSVGTIDGGAGGTHSVTLGAAGADQVLLSGTENSVYTGAGAVRLIRTDEGADLIQIGTGGAQVVQSGGGNDIVSAWAGNVDYLDPGTGDDIVSLNHQTSMISLFDAGGDDSLTLNNTAFIAAATLANGTKTVTLNDDARIDYLRILGAGASVSLDTDARIGSYYAFDATTALTVGAGGIGQVLLEGPGAGVQSVSATGFIGALRVADNQTADVRLGAGGAGSVELSGGDDSVAANGSWVEYLSTGDGADRIDTVASTLRFLDSGHGDDTISLAGSVIQSLSDFGGNDTFTLADDSEIQQAELIGDTKTLTLLGTASVGAMLLYDTTLQLSTELGLVRSLVGYGASAELAIGDGGLDAASFTSYDLGETFDLQAIGFVGALNLVGAMTANVTLGLAGGGSLRLGSGNDSVETAGGFVETIVTATGDDSVFVGTGGAETVRLGGGDDTLSLADRPTDQLLVARGGAGTDMMSFAALSGGVTFTLDPVGLQNPASAGGALGLDGLGLLIAHGFENVTGTEFIDRITGDAGDNEIFGLGSFDRLSGLGGNDVLDGGAGDDLLLGGAGADVLLGGDGVDNLKGGLGNDRLQGGAGGDILSGGGGADLLAGGEGNDVLTGNAGADEFLFGANGGRDRVTDFQRGLDLLLIEDHDGGFADLRISKSGNALRVVHDGGVILLDGMAGVKLTAADFDFV